MVESLQPFVIAIITIVPINLVAMLFCCSKFIDIPRKSSTVDDGDDTRSEGSQNVEDEVPERAQLFLRDDYKEL